MMRMSREEKRKGGLWLILLGLMMIAWGVIQYVGIEWWPAMLIVFGVFFIIWGLLAVRGVAGFEKD